MNFLKLLAVLIGLTLCGIAGVFMFFWFMMFIIGAFAMMSVCHCLGLPIVVKHDGKRVGVMKHFKYYPDRYRF